MLLIPKNHSEDILSMESAEYQKLMAVGKTMAEKVKNIFNPKRVTFMIVGLEVAHTHLHIFPINSVDNLDTKTAYDATIEELAEVQSLYLS